MTKLFAGLFAAALVFGLGAAPTLTYAEEATTEGAAEGATESAGGSKDESMMEKLEETFKETPTDEATNPIEADEDTDGDLF